MEIGPHPHGGTEGFLCCFFNFSCTPLPMQGGAFK